jgi:hypothetical protein
MTEEPKDTPYSAYLRTEIVHSLQKPVSDALGKWPFWSTTRPWSCTSA